jgi:phage major head subunit gpT-like protein
MWDFRTDDVIAEILPPSAMVVRGGREFTTLLNSHKRNSTDDIVGRAENFRVSGGDLIATLRFDNDENSQRVFDKVRSGSLTDLSIGYAVLESRYLQEGETITIKGRSYSGPAKVATRYELQEVSTVPIGADSMATFRSLEHKSGNSAGANQPKEEGFPVEDSPKAPVAKPEERSAPVPVAPAVDENKIRSEAVRAERERTNEIRSIAAQAGVDKTKVDEAIDNDVTVDAFRKIALEAVAERNKQITSKANGERIEVGTEQSQKFVSAATDGLRIRAGAKVEKPAPGHEQFVGAGFEGLARQCLVQKGASWEKVGRMSKDEIFARAFSKEGRQRGIYLQGRSVFNHTPDDFPSILSNTANKSLQDEFAMQPVTYDKFVSVASVSDFKTKTVNKLSEGQLPEKIGVNGEIPHGNYQEDYEQYRVYTYAKKIGITREALYNDDMSAFSRLPRKIANQFQRNNEMLVYSLLIGSGGVGETMRDTKAVFHADHNNLMTSGGAPSVATLNAAFALMQKQTGLDGSILNVSPQFILAGPELRATIDALLNSTSDPAASNSAVRNSFQGALTPLISPYISTAFTFDGVTYAADTNRWYLAASPSSIDTIEMSFLNGVNAPTLEEKDGWDTLGMEWRAYYDVGAKTLEHRGLLKNDGGA